jgi:hypothetical protein
MEGDQNTSCFHLSTLKHRANNRIAGIKKGNSLLSHEKDISAEVISFFSSLLSRDPSLSDLDQIEIVSYIPQIIQPYQNKALTAIPKEEEVKEALFSLPADKAPGPDGFPTFFFQIFW